MAAKKINLAIDQEELAIIYSALTVAETHWLFTAIKTSDWINLEFSLSVQVNDANAINKQIRKKLKKLYNEQYLQHGLEKTR